MRRQPVGAPCYMSCVALVALALPGTGLAQQSLTWDVNGAQTAVGGSGAWNTSSNFWFTGTTHQAWNNAAFDRAVFAGSAGTVSVANGINVNHLSFNVGGYTLSGGTLAFGGLSPGITTQVAVTTISSALTGATGFTKDGIATLALGGNSTTYTGITRVSAGTLRVDSANALGLSAAAGNLVLDSGATFSVNTNFSHNYTLTGGTVNIQGGAFTWSGAPTLTAGTTLNLNSSQSGGTLSGNLTDTGANVLSITRNGPGRLTLSGTNSYTGATTVVAGHLQLGSAGGLSAASNLVFGGAAGAGGDLELTAASGNFARTAGTGANQVQWTGDGGFVSSGVARTVNLGGAGAQLAWSAGSFVPTGNRLILGTSSNNTLDFQNAIDLGSGTRSVQGDGGNVSGHARLSGVLSGAGGLNQVGNGILGLTGTNTYSGGTTMSSGTVLVATDSNLGASAGQLSFGGGILQNTGAFSTARGVLLGAAGGTFRTDADLLGSGVIAGSGRLTKTGVATLTLTGANTHSGGTTVSAGTLQVGNGANLGSIGGDVINNAILAFDRLDTLGFEGSISGTGSLQQRGTGTLLLTGANLYTGGTTINQGTLQIGNGSASGSIVGNVLNNGVLAFQLSGAPVFSGSISGTGAVEQRGPGTLRLAGNSGSFTGSTSVSNGTLAVEGVLGGTMNVLSGGRLQGTGTVGTTQVLAGGVLAPGSPFGTLNIAGNASFAPDSIYETRTDAAGTIALLHVTGSVTINGGTVRVVTPGSIFRTGARYTIVAADAGRTGQFTGVIETQPLLDMALAYGPNAVYLDVARNSSTICSFAVTQNQCATSTTDASLGSGNPVFDSVVNLPTLAAIQDALDRLSGEVHASANGAMVENSRFMRDAVMHGMRSPPDQGGASASTRAWGTFVNESARTAGDGNAASTTGRTRGFFVGSFPWTVGAFRVGIAGGHTSDAIDADARESSRTGDNYHVALYGMGEVGTFDLRLGTALSLHRFRTHRVVQYSGFSDVTDANRKAHTVQVFGEVAHGMNFGSLTVEPFVGLAYVRVTTDGFAESGGPSALRGAKGEQALTYATFGVNMSHKISALGGDASAHFKLGWRHAEGSLATTAQHSIGSSTSFVVAGLPFARNTVLLDSGLAFKLSRGLTAGVAYTGQFAKGRQNNGLRADFTWAF